MLLVTRMDFRLAMLLIAESVFETTSISSQISLPIESLTPLLIATLLLGITLVDFITPLRGADLSIALLAWIRKLITCLEFSVLPAPDSPLITIE
jgi:hypothetical protein